MTSVSPPGPAKPIHATSRAEAAREAFVQRGLRLNWLTIGYNTLEAVVSIVAGLLAGSVALVGFGFNSAIEVTSAGAAQWRLRADLDPARRERVEHMTLRVIGWTFLALTAYVLYDSGKTLWFRERPERSIAGIVILVLVGDSHALARASKETGGPRSRQSGAGGGRAADVPLRLFVRDRAAWTCPQRAIRLVVGRPGVRTRDDADHRQGGSGRRTGQGVRLRCGLISTRFGTRFYG